MMPPKPQAPTTKAPVQSTATSSKARASSALLGEHSEQIMTMMKRQMTLLEQQGRAIADLQKQQGTPTTEVIQQNTPVNVGTAQTTPTLPHAQTTPPLPLAQAMPLLSLPPPPPFPTTGQSDDPADGHPGHPFTPHIMEYQVPQGYLGPTNIPRYNGLSDPMEHILSFEGALNFYGGGDRMKCRAFSMTLHPSVLRWYSSLPRHSVNSWRDMRQVFLNRYTASCIQPRSDHTLATVTQKSEESLREYLARFHQESSSVPHLEAGVAVLLFTQGLLPGDFRNSLIGKPPRTMAELRQRSTKFINLEEFNKSLRLREGKQPVEAQDAEPAHTKPRRDDRPRMRREAEKDNRRPPPRLRYDEYTPLNAPRAQIWKETMQAELRHVPRPPFIRRQTPRNKGKYCDFHEGFGHTTDQCTWLKDVIEDMVRSGKLTQYVREAFGRRSHRRSLTPEKEKEKREREATPEDKGQQKKQVDLIEAQASDHSPKHFRVETIAGGFAGGGESRADRKKYINQILSVNRNPPKRKPSKNIPICFSDEDLEGILPDHNDPMIISALLGNFEVARIFVDQGSSADVMFLSLFHALKLSKADLTPFEGNLIGFTGDSIRPLGYIKLPMTLGKARSARTELINFLVVNCPSAYNAILGRTCLQAFGAVVSTVHLAMKFVGSDDKVVTVKAEQEKARLCYNASLRTRGEPGKNQGKEKGKVMMAELAEAETSTNPKPKRNTSIPKVKKKGVSLGRKRLQVVGLPRKKCFKGI